MTDLVSQLVGALKSVQAAIYMDDAGQLRLTRSFDESTIDAALTAAKAGGWMPIETAPKDGTRILVWRKHATRPLIAWYQKDFEWFEDEDGVHLYHLIYWQPLPNPPKEQA